ncbi:NADH-cytochrome b5 reductase 2 [Teratosphaeria destructans]|uniref:NADH-cytochrome b5 reductase 2 n=1 Tax=Teratosphaeria destructans TaxID=418781 RepID=A0A9W7SNN9_9PEZI|nr:NADH-cytochrome b5 reductase 2 [Teratosphaeria destructans]
MILRIGRRCNCFGEWNKKRDIVLEPELEELEQRYPGRVSVMYVVPGPEAAASLDDGRKSGPRSTRRYGKLSEAAGVMRRAPKCFSAVRRAWKMHLLGGKVCSESLGWARKRYTGSKLYLVC